MKTIEITVKSEQTGLDNFTDFRNCPIACGLRNMGYKDPRVGSSTWSAIKLIFGFIPWRFRGTIPFNTNERAYYISVKKQDSDITLTIKKY